jgi:hypothetical protein
MFLTNSCLPESAITAFAFAIRSTTIARTSSQEIGGLGVAAGRFPPQPQSLLASSFSILARSSASSLPIANATLSIAESPFEALDEKCVAR